MSLIEVSRIQNVSCFVAACFSKFGKENRSWILLKALKEVRMGISVQDHTLRRLSRIFTAKSLHVTLRHVHRGSECYLEAMCGPG